MCVCVCVCVCRFHKVSDRKAAPASEIQKAQAGVSDASLIRGEAFISASPQWTAILSVRSARTVLTLDSIPAPELENVALLQLL